MSEIMCNECSGYGYEDDLFIQCEKCNGLGVVTEEKERELESCPLCGNQPILKTEGSEPVTC